MENTRKVSLRCLIDKCPPVPLNYRQRINQHQHQRASEEEMQKLIEQGNKNTNVVKRHN